MAKKPGNPNLYKGMPSLNPNGRPKGSKNKTTENIRKAYQQLTEDNLDNMTVWLAQIAAEDPKQAMELMIKLSEYVIPKLARQEITGNDGADLFSNVKFEFGPDVNDTDARDFDLEDYTE